MGTGGVQLDGNSDSGIGGFVAGGVNNGDPNSISPGLQTGFGFSGQGGQTVATAQLGGSVQAPHVAGVNFNRPNNAFGVQPTVLNQPAPGLNLFNLFGQQGRLMTIPKGRVVKVYVKNMELDEKNFKNPKNFDPENFAP